MYQTCFVNQGFTTQQLHLEHLYQQSRLSGFFLVFQFFQAAYLFYLQAQLIISVAFRSTVKNQPIFFTPTFNLLSTNYLMVQLILATVAQLSSLTSYSIFIADFTPATNPFPLFQIILQVFQDDLYFLLLYSLNLTFLSPPILIHFTIFLTWIKLFFNSPYLHSLPILSFFYFCLFLSFLRSNLNFNQTYFFTLTSFSIFDCEFFLTIPFLTNFFMVMLRPSSTQCQLQAYHFQLVLALMNHPPFINYFLVWIQGALFYIFRHQLETNSKLSKFFMCIYSSFMQTLMIISTWLSLLQVVILIDRHLRLYSSFCY